MKSSSYLLWNIFLGLLLWVSVGDAARASTLIHAKAKAAATATPVNVTLATDEVTVEPSANETALTNGTKLTGVPQIDYVHDPNLPRELNGHNLTDYPFYNSLPEDIAFKCDGLHDGFYASVLYKCQVYHHCLFGTRYDFLCANYTAFDQRTFICHFASEVDCKNSPKHYKRNEALYKAATTTTLAPLTTTSTSPSGRRRRPYRRRKPAYDYYDDYSEDDDYENGDERPKEGGKKPRPQKESSSDEEPLPTGPNKALYDRPRVAPKIRRPVPVNEREKYDYSSDSRVIPTKSSQEQSSVAEDDKTDTNKRKNKPRVQDGQAESGKGRDRERYRERDRFRDREDEKEPERDRPPTRDGIERDRPPTRDDSERDRGRIREDEDRDVERERPRNRRPAKKRKRPDPYDYYDDYEEVRRPKPRERPRYEEDEDEEDYEDDRYYRKPLRSRDRDRDRERDRDRDRYRPKDDEEDRRGKPRRREYEGDDDRYPAKDSDRSRDNYEGGSRKSSWRDNERQTGEDDSVFRNQPETSSRGAIEKLPKKTQKPEDTYSEETIETDSKAAAYDDVSEERSRASGSAEKSSEANRPKQSWRQRTSTAKPLLQTDPVPAARPAYITQTQPKVIKKQPESPRKPTGFRRQTTQKYSSEEGLGVEVEEEIPKIVEEQNPPLRSSTKKKNPQPEELQINVPEPIVDSYLPERVPVTQKPIVPVDQDFAPRAPKVPIMSNRRRPFLPSRGGDPSLLRGLTPVGAKAFTAPKREEVPAQTSRERFTTKVEPKKIPTGIEFRTRVGANLGVELPRLTPTLSEEPYSQEEDYSGEVADSDESIAADFASRAQTQQVTKQEIYRIGTTEKTAIPIRPTLRTTDFPSLPDVHGGIEHHTQIQQESNERKYSSRLPNSNSQYLSGQQQSKPQTYQQLGPQTFFSDNPKFHTTVPLANSEQRQAPINANFQPAFYQPIIKSGQGQVQVVHFQKTAPSPQPRNPLLKFPQENLEDTDEYDVSFNDALQPISTLHPRNAQTGIVGSQRAAVRRRMPTSNNPYNAPDETKLKSESQRISATVIHPLSVHAPHPHSQSYIRAIHSETRPLFVR